MKLWLGVSLLLSASVALPYTSATQTSQHLVGTATIGEAVDIYNKGNRENAAFRLLEVESGHGEEGALPLKFKIKETLCLKTEKQNLQKCDFKDNGLVKACSASLLEEPDRPALVVNCDSVTIPSFRSKRSRGRSSSRSNGNRRKSIKKPERIKIGKPVHPGMFTVLDEIKATPIFQTKEVQKKKKGSNENNRQPRGKNCTGGINCQKGPLALSPSAFSTIERYEPAAADTKALRPKRSPNTNGSSNGNRKKPTKPKCRAGNKCEKEPMSVNTGHWSAIAQLRVDSVDSAFA